MKTKTALLLSASLTALLATGCGAASLAQSPFGATPSSDGTNIASASATDDSNSAIGPTPAAIDGPAQPATDGMTPASVRFSDADGVAPAKAAPPVNASGSADSAPDMTDPTKTKI
jgi:hypothetical protein